MAKKTEPMVHVATLDYTAGEQTLDLAKLSPQMVSYLLNYGFQKTLQDCVAGVAKQAAGAYLLPDSKEYVAFCEKASIDPDSRSHTPEAFSLAVVKAMREARLAAIVDGTVGLRATSSPIDPVAAMMSTIARERIAAAHRAKGLKAPTKDAMADWVARYLAKQGEALRLEATTRLAATSAVSLEDLGI